MIHFLRMQFRALVLWLVTWRIRRWSNNRMMGGAFLGMRYVDKAICSSLAPKLLGIYEKELSEVMEEIRLLRPPAIVDIGAAEGYYAVGLLFANFTSKVIAFEATSGGQDLIRQLAAMNSVSAEHLQIEGLCSPSTLDACLGRLERPVVIMDTEGHEALLLDPLRIPHLASAHILAEMHDCLLGGITETLAERMRSTHTVIKISSQPRTLSEVSCADPLFRCLPKRWRLLAASESRPGTMHWLWLKPKSPAGPRA